MLDADEIRKGREAVSRWIHFWEGVGLMTRAPTMMQFDALVRYQFGDKDLQYRTDGYVSLSGQSIHNITLHDRGGLTAERHYTGFSPVFNYISTLKVSKKLRVKGNGPKLGGDYVVDIQPT